MKKCVEPLQKQTKGVTFFSQNSQLTFSLPKEKYFHVKDKNSSFYTYNSQLPKAGGNLKRLFSSNYKAESSQTFILIHPSLKIVDCFVLSHIL